MIHAARRCLEYIGLSRSSAAFRFLLGFKQACLDPIRRMSLRRRAYAQSFRTPNYPINSKAWRDILRSYRLPFWPEVPPSVDSGNDQDMVSWIAGALFERGGAGKVAERAWLLVPDLERAGYSKLQAERAIGDAIAARPGDRVLRYMDDKPWFLECVPFALTPAGRSILLDWLLGVCVAHLHEVSLGDVLWLMLDLDADPSLGLAATWLRSPTWQKRWPLALTKFGALQWIESLALNHPGLAADPERVSDCLGSILPLSHQVALADAEGTLSAAQWAQETRIKQSEASNLIEGFNILGHCAYPSGVGETQRMMTLAARAVGCDTATRDVPADWRFDLPTRPDYLAVEPYDITVCSIPIFSNMPAIYRKAGLHRRSGVHRIGFWVWELDKVPDEYARHAQSFDEIWTNTQFVADVVRKAIRMPVHVVLPGVTITQKTPVSRQELGLDPDKYLFMFVFDVASVMERKNPLALVEAYRNAFRGDDRVQLAFKITRSSFDPVGVARLKAEVASVGGVVIDRDLPRDQAYGVLDACDCYVSLHRSEGYGITIAEAMLMGKPTIATGYSGNVDFMSEEDTFMIPYKLEPIKIDLPYYPRGCHWATADTQAAAERMRWVFEHQGEAKSMGLKASARVSELIGMKAYGARIMDRVRAIRLEKHGLLRHKIAH